MIRRSIRLTFGAKAQPGITLQRGDCFSTAICAQCYAPNGCPVSFEGRTVHVVYQTGGQSSPGYEVEATGSQSLPALSGENVLITNADSLTVTGRADPVQTINALNDRIAALEDAALNSIGGV